MRTFSKNAIMTQTSIQRSFAPLKKYLPRFLSNPIRSFVTASLTPILFSYKTGHLRSSFQMAAVSRDGEALPWYTYPCIDFLRFREFRDKTVLEFGGGQSTIWWAKRANRVITLEGDKEWYEIIKQQVPANADVSLISMETPTACLNHVKDVLREVGHKFDVVIIDGLYRYEMIEVARSSITETGIIICDNAEGYGIHEGFKHSGMNRVDFFGHAPGVVLPSCTSIFFGKESFIVSSENPIPVIAKEYFKS